MGQLLLSGFLFLLFGMISCQGDTYLGAVVEFNALWNFSLTDEENVLKNAGRYSNLIHEAANQSAVIIVFPEMGMVGSTNSYFIEVPDPVDGIVPWKTDTSNPALKIISKAASDKGIYVVINVLEKKNSSQGLLKYNTNVVFDRSGTVISRYRKFNLFGENYLNRTKEAEYAVFKTDFNVTFGTFTCFDILFRDPAMVLIEKYNVTDIAFPTFWFSELPFLTALQAQQGWSLYNNANLLAAGQNQVGRGSSGSGVYSPAGNIQYVYQSVTEFNDRLIVGTVYKKGSSPGALESTTYERGVGDSKGSSLNLLKEDLTSYETRLLSMDLKGATKVSTNQYRIVRQEGICQNDFCCGFTLDYNITLVPRMDWSNPTTLKGDEFQYFRYRLAARDGVRSFTGMYNGGIQICAVIPCLTDSFETCGVQTNKQTIDTPSIILDENGLTLALSETKFNSIKIQGVFQGQNSSIWPNAMEMNPNQKQFGRLFTRFDEFVLTPMGNKIGASLTVKHSTMPTKLVTAALYGRIFDRDGPPVPASATWSATHSLSSAIIAAAASLIVYNIFHHFY